jgi:hypothetical protein
MKRYNVMGLIDASVGCEVEAESPEDAIEAAEGALDFSLCHQCSSKVTAYNVYDHVVVDDETGEEVISSQSDKGRKRIAELEAENTKLRGFVADLAGSVRDNLELTLGLGGEVITALMKRHQL